MDFKVVQANEAPPAWVCEVRMWISVVPSAADRYSGHGNTEGCLFTGMEHIVFTGVDLS